ncbi:Uncharacterized conserved protein YndB, AHSA1/START domain [Dyadobacter koreensis]|uniref:Uncharacterized conserved protein YndB, AHSA1/START domain n=1 Tax=Dyadobacter koreensis TaxID=408657 RepID=A0A1H6VHU2_9BACT|nr:SRPBCC domain-containing protein [Dyadobacter koreensis]SEJ01307.1 Uncharacterized conserved protein YndB, AHSA1/START domain [Dyadobacter koreensis]
MMETQKPKYEAFVIERVYEAPAAEVWQAITDNEKMKKWYFQLQDFKAEIGFAFEFTAENEGVKYVHKCVVTDVVPHRKLAYSWRYDDYPGDSLVTFELFPEGNKTKIRLTHEGLESFPDLRDFKRESFAAGWNEIIGKLLKEFVE